MFSKMNIVRYIYFVKCILIVAVYLEIIMPDLSYEHFSWNCCCYSNKAGCSFRFEYKSQFFRIILPQLLKLIYWSPFYLPHFLMAWLAAHRERERWTIFRSSVSQHLLANLRQLSVNINYICTKSKSCINRSIITTHF